MLLRQSTAATLTIGPILDANGAEYTGAVIGDISVSKNGTLAALASAATLTHSANGIYTLALTTGNTDTLGRLQLVCNKSTYQMPLVGVNVVPATVYDALVTNAVNTNGGLAVGTGNITALAGAISTLTPAGTAVAVWDALLASYTAADSFGAHIVRSVNSNNAVQITGGQTPHIAAVVHDAEPNSIPEDAFATDAFSARLLAADAVSEIQSGLATAAALATVQADTDDIQSRLPAALVSGRMDSHTGAMGTNTLTAAATAADFVAEVQSGLSTLTAAQVNAELLDVLATDLFAELAAVPAASSSLKDKISFLFMLARNKVTQTSSTQTLFADNTTTPVAASTTADVGGTFTRGEFT